MTEKMITFLKEASKDKAFLEKLQNAETAEALIALAAEKGFQLTAEDLDQLKTVGGELSDDELADVAGGANVGSKLGTNAYLMMQRIQKMQTSKFF